MSWKRLIVGALVVGGTAAAAKSRKARTWVSDRYGKYISKVVQDRLNRR